MCLQRASSKKRVNIRHRKRLLVGMFCGLVVGLIALTPTYQSHRESIPSKQPLLDRGFEHFQHVFALDDKISSIRLSEADQHQAPFIEESLLPISGRLEFQPQRRTLVTLREDYEVEIDKTHTIFYHQPTIPPDSPLHKQVTEYCLELFDNPPLTRKQELRKELHTLLESAQFTPMISEYILYPYRKPDSESHPHQHGDRHHHGDNIHAHSHDAK